MARDVFISHSAKDKTIADAMCAALESSGVRCWTAPRDIVPGLEWGEAIIDAIDETRLMILIVSSNANESHQIKREVERAVNRGKIVIPFRIEDVPLSKSLEYYVSTNHWLDALTPPLGRHLQQLTDTVKLLLARLSAGVHPATVQFCPNCGSQYRKGAGSCSKCGLSLITGTAQGEPDRLTGIQPAGSLEPPPITRPLPEPLNEPRPEKSVGKVAAREKSKSRKYVIIGATSLLIMVAALSGVLFYVKSTSPTGPRSPADIAKAYAGSVVFIEAGWKLTCNGGGVYHKYIPNQWKDPQGSTHAIVNDGRSLVAVYTSIRGLVEPMLSLDNRLGPVIGGEHDGSGFVVTNDGFILTNRHVAATWRTSYTFPPPSTPGVVINDGKISLKADGNPVLLAAPTDWVPSETRQVGAFFQASLEGKNDYLNVTFAKGELRIPAKVAQVSDRHDVAMLKIDVPGSVPKVELYDNYETIKQGDALTVLGYPEYSTSVSSVKRSAGNRSHFLSRLIKIIPDPTISVGNIGRVIRGQDSNGSAKDMVDAGFGDAYQLMINSSGEGNSGAPVFDDHGRVVGVLFAGSTAVGASVTYAVPIRYGKELMRTSAPTGK